MDIVSAAVVNARVKRPSSAGGHTSAFRAAAPIGEDNQAAVNEPMPLRPLIRRLTPVLLMLAALPVVGATSAVARAHPSISRHGRAATCRHKPAARRHVCRSAKPKHLTHKRSGTTPPHRARTGAPRTNPAPPTKRVQPTQPPRPAKPAAPVTTTKSGAQAPTTSTSGAPTQDPQATPFAPTSVWNQALASNAPLDHNSQTYVSDLLQQVTQDGTWMNTYAYSSPIFTVPATQPTVTVALDSASSASATALAGTWLTVPLPASAKPASGGDAHMIIWQPSTDRLWEFWEMHQAADGWHAAWGGTINNVSSDPGYYTGWTGWGAAATGLPLLGGLIRPSELAAGHIDHALSIGIPAAQAATFAWPAQRTDGYVWSSSAIPEGQRFRLDPTLDLKSIPMAPIVRMIAVAAQKYGIIVRDQAGAVTFYGEEVDAEGQADPYYGPSGYFQGQYISNLLKSFPWSHLEAMNDTLSCCWHS